MTIKGICVHVERRDKISETTYSTPQHAFKNSIDSSIPLISYVMQPSTGKMKKPFLINFFFIHNAFEAII